jgi:hypothetical protein
MSMAAPATAVMRCLYTLVSSSTAISSSAASSNGIFRGAEHICSECCHKVRRCHGSAEMLSRDQKVLHK